MNASSNERFDSMVSTDLMDRNLIPGFWFNYTWKINASFLSIAYIFILFEAKSQFNTVSLSSAIGFCLRNWELLMTRECIVQKCLSVSPSFFVNQESSFLSIFFFLPSFLLLSHTYPIQFDLDPCSLIPVPLCLSQQQQQQQQAPVLFFSPLLLSFFVSLTLINLDLWV